MLSKETLRDLLESKYNKYNQVSFIKDDPISIPHQFLRKEDIEISAFLTATISWGQRKAIIKSANYLMELMESIPYDFILHSNKSDLNRLIKFYYRTFNNIDIHYFIVSLKNIYKTHGGLEGTFSHGTNTKEKISNFRNLFFELDYPQRTTKHISNVDKNSAGKRLNMFLRWMNRKDNKKVDFGIWSCISPSELIIPLDIHTGNISRELGLLHRNSNDWTAAYSLTNELRFFDKTDPVKYDFALFGMGINKDF